jgi:hypothetical protein
MSKKSKNYLKVAKEKIIKKNLPVLRPSRLKSEVHKSNLRNKRK